jgi:hypothetical protein
MPEEAMTMWFVGYAVRAPLTVATIGVETLDAAGQVVRVGVCRSVQRRWTASDSCWRGNRCDGPGPVID